MVPTTHKRGAYGIKGNLDEFRWMGGIGERKAHDPILLSYMVLKFYF